MDPPGLSPPSLAAARDWRRVAVWLVASTLAYNVLEAVVALWSGAVADSVALIGFGFDSVIEVAAAAALLWRFSVEASGASQERIERAEHRVHRFIGRTFLALAAYVVADAAWTLWRRETPDESVVGIVLASASLVLMPLASWGKLRVAAASGARPCGPRPWRPSPARTSPSPSSSASPRTPRSGGGGPIPSRRS